MRYALILLLLTGCSSLEDAAGNIGMGATPAGAAKECAKREECR